MSWCWSPITWLIHNDMEIPLDCWVPNEEIPPLEQSEKPDKAFGDPPTLLHPNVLEPKFYLDPLGKEHRSDGPAIEFKDGTGLCRWHGVAIPAHWLKTPPTIQEIKSEQNQELRRCGVEILGVEKWLAALEAKVIDSDLGKIAARALLEDSEGTKWLQCHDGSTGRVYYLQAPRESKTCREAHELLAGVDETKIVGES